jgi:hypothetical protein
MKMIAFIALCGFVLLPSAFAGSINFEMGAPSDFNQTTALTNTYSVSLGVTFSGPGGNNGGAILDQGSGFGVNAHSGVDFLAFNTTSATLSNGGTPEGPETIAFATPVFNVGLWVGGETSGSTYTLMAYNSAGSLLGSTSILPTSGSWSQLTIGATNISSLVLSFNNTFAVVDDLTWNSNGSVPEPSTLALLGFGMAALAGFARRRRSL